MFSATTFPEDGQAILKCIYDVSDHGRDFYWSHAAKHKAEVKLLSTNVLTCVPGSFVRDGM